METRDETWTRRDQSVRSVERNEMQRKPGIVRAREIMALEEGMAGREGKMLARYEPSRENRGR